MRQDNVKEDARINEQRSPNKRSFGEAKQALTEYDDMNQMNQMNQINAYNEGLYNSENTFLEADEDDAQQQLQQQQQSYQSNYYNTSEPKLQYEEDDVALPMRHNIENYMAEPQYSPPEESWYPGGRRERPQRRRSREFADNEVMIPNEDEHHRRKPEAMRSISEDTPTRTAKQAVTRRTLSHPEKDTHSQVASTIQSIKHIVVS